MRLILEKDVKNLGKAGDEISVKAGYARNCLLPKKLAIPLNETRRKEWKHKKYIIEIRKKKAEEERGETISKLAKIHLTFEKEARNQNQLFGSVSAVEISKMLEEKHGLFVDKKDILSEPLKTTGQHKVKITLDSKRETFLSITINKSAHKKDISDSEKEAVHLLEKQELKTEPQNTLHNKEKQLEDSATTGKELKNSENTDEKTSSDKAKAVD